jgi:hypothetical protein
MLGKDNLVSGRGATLHTSDRPFRKARHGFAVSESYCPVCGMFIAASPNPQLLTLVERLHRCRRPSKLPEGTADLSQARLVAYAFEKPLRERGLPWQYQLAPFMRKLAPQRPALNQWLHSSEANAKWFRRDPIGAVRAANLGIEERLLKELDSVTSTIAQRLKTNS